VPIEIRIILIALPLIAAMVRTAAVAEQDPFILSCTAFSATLTAAELVARYGASNVKADKIHIGEGEFEDGTVLYPDEPKRRAEILWKERNIQRSPQMIRVTAAESQWRTFQGLALGLTLREVEKLNRRPFRLSGFGWDYGGTTIRWSGGALESKGSKDCNVWARFQSEPSTPAEVRLARQVMGDKEFSSGHPGMQASNARVYQFGLHFTDRQ
jgi:hypothetical protein